MMGAYRRLMARLQSPPGERAERYVVKFTRIERPDGQHYLPQYALHRPACVQMLKGGVYEADTHAAVRRLLAERPGDMVHAGTFFGDMLPIFSKACSGRVYAFEPVLENYVLARLSVDQNELANVVLLNAALGEELGITHMDTGERLHRGGSSKVAGAGQTATMLPIDLLGLANLSVLHLDVEGYELPALKGAVATIKRCKPTILIEDNEKACGPFLEGLGYSMVEQLSEVSVWAA